MITDVDRAGTDIDQGNENAERRPESPEIVGINRPNKLQEETGDDVVELHTDWPPELLYVVTWRPTKHERAKISTTSPSVKNCSRAAHECLIGTEEIHGEQEIQGAKPRKDRNFPAMT